jgi:voltage-gated potassium channel
MGTTQRTLPQQMLRVARGHISRLHARRGSINAFVARHQLAWDLAMAALALLYIGASYFEDHPISILAETTLMPLELAITAVFLAEFVLRFYAAESRRRYLTRHWIDLLALLPALRALRFLRLTRLAYLFNAARALRLTVLLRFLAELDRVGRDLHGVARRNGVPVFLALAGGIVLAGGTLVWGLEHTANPAFRNFGDAIWWTFATMSTVGYGPGPETPWGRVLAAVIMVVGIACFGVLTATVSAYFVERAQRQETDEVEVSLHDVMALLRDIELRLDRIEQQDRLPPS